MPGSVLEVLQYDLVALVEPGLGEPVIPPAWLARFVRERGGGLLIVGLWSGDPKTAGDLASVLPVSPGAAGGASDTETRVRLTPAGEAAPTTRVVSDRFENLDVWASLPPVWAPGGPFSLRAGSDVLAETGAPGGVGTPVIVTGRSGAGAVMAILARDIWRWKMAGPAGVDAYGRFLANATRWLTARGELERLVVASDKDVYVAGERAGFSAQVYREDYRIATDASVEVSASRGEGAAPVGSIVLRPEGDSYRGEMPALAPGRYVFEARGRARGRGGGDRVG